MCYERYKSLLWALGRRRHILSGKRTRPPDVCLLVCLWQRVSLLSWLYQLPTTQPLFSLKAPSISRQPTLRIACCYRRTFPPSISRMTVFNAIWKILSERLDDGSGISRNKCVMSDTKACYEHWADADISFLRKEKTALSALCTLHYCTLCLSLVSSPNHPTLSPLKTLSTSRQPTFWTACCYRRTFPPSISRMTAFNAIWKILSERLDDGSGLNCIWLLWGGWLIRTLQVFVLIVSSRISRNRCVMSSLLWALGRRGHILSEKGKDRLMSACTLHYCTLCFSLVSSPDHPPLLMASSTMLVLLRRSSTSLYPDSYWRLSPVQI